MILKHNKIITVIRSESQIREQMSGPDLHVFTLKFLALKKVFFSCFRGQKKIQIVEETRANRFRIISPSLK